MEKLGLVKLTRWSGIQAGGVSEFDKEKTTS